MQHTVLIAGGSGMIGRKLKEVLESRNFNVVILSRHPGNRDGYFYWDPEKNEFDERALTHVDTVINLAGANIGSQRWTAQRKRKIINSRLVATRYLYQKLTAYRNQIKVFINASAIGIYGDTGDLIIHEDYPPDDGFLGNTCSRWEQAAMQFETIGIRTVIFRIGIVLSEQGGMLKEIKKPVQFGICPIFGNGNQYQSWIHIADLCKMMAKAITNENLKGVYNAVAPGPVSNKNFMKLYIHIKNKRCIPTHIPAFLLKLFLGEMSAIVLTGSRVSSEKIEKSGFTFNFPQANMALRDILGK